MKKWQCEVKFTLFNRTTFGDNVLDLTSSEYGRSEDRGESAGDYNASGLFFSDLAAKLLHVSGQTARPARETGQSQTPLNRGLTAESHSLRQRLTTLRPRNRELIRTYTDGVRMGSKQRLKFEKVVFCPEPTGWSRVPKDEQVTPGWGFCFRSIKSRSYATCSPLGITL